jgi:hypothetical protein
MSLRTINPASGETLATHEEMTPEEVRGIIGKVHETWLDCALRAFGRVRR